MSDQQVKEFFASVLDGGPADRLDLDRAVAAGRRRRRIRTATTVGSAAAVLVLVGALVVSALPRADRSDLGGATLSPTPSATEPSASIGPDVVVPGTAEDWMRALAPYLPAGTQTPAVTTTFSRNLGIVRAVFRYNGADGRATALVVTAYSPGDRSFEQAYNALQQSCSTGGLTCEKTSQATSGPVLIRRADDGTEVSVSSVRTTGVVVTVDSWNGDTDTTQLLPGSGAPGFSTEEQVFELVALAATVPLPAQVMPTPTPTPTPTLDTPTTEPQPTPVNTAFGPGPTPSPSLVITTGLRGVAADGVCPTSASEDEPAALPIAGEPLTLRICPPVGSPASFGTEPVDLSTADGFKRLLELLGRPDQPFTPPTPSPDPTIQYACPALGQVKPTVFAMTSTGTYRLELPSYDLTPDGCTFVQEDVLSALMSALGRS